MVIKSLAISTCVCLATCLLINPSSIAQTRKASSNSINTSTQDLPSDTLYLDFSRDIGNQLIPFDSLYKLALSYSPVLKEGVQLTNLQEAAYRLSKIAILSTVAPFANVSTGNQAIISPGADNALGQITNGYRAGVGIQLGLDDIFGRPQKIRQAHANYIASIHRKEAIALQLKHDLITIYQDLLTAQRVMKVRMQDEQVSLTALRLVEIEMQQGKATPDEVATVSSRYTQTKALAEGAKGEFLKNLYYLEAVVGYPIQQLKRA